MQRSPEVVAAYESLCEALRGGDADALDRILASEVRVIGTDPAEWLGPDHAGVVAILRTQLQEAGGSFPLNSQHPEGFSDGDTGWIADEPRMRMPDGNEVAFRVSGVVRRNGNNWQFVQLHLSIGVSNQEALGIELTTEAPAGASAG